MSIILVANNATTTLAAGLSPSATSLTVAAGSGALYPSPQAGQYFVLSLISADTAAVAEIVNVTARSGDTMTVVRAQEGTSALTWAIGDTAANYWTAGQAAALAQSVNVTPYTVITRTAGQALAAHKVIKTVGATGGNYADANTPGDANLVLGISVAAAANAAPVTIQFGGEIVDGGWNWTPGPVYLGLSGALTQTPTGQLVIRQIATAVTATRIVVNIQPVQVLPAMSLEYVADSPFTLSAAWAKVTTTDATTLALQIGDVSEAPAAYDTFYTWVPHNAGVPDPSVLGFAVGQEKLMLAGIPTGDIYLRAAYSAATVSVAQA